MAKKKGWISDVRKFTTEARRSASSIFEHAGSFLLRAVCDEVAALIRELADKVDELDGENSQLKWEVVKRDEEIAALQQDVDQLDALLRSYEVIPLDDVPTSSEGLTGGQAFPKGTP